MIFSEGKLEKMKIKAFKDLDFKEEVPDGDIEVLINPENFKESYTISYIEDQATGTAEKDQKFNHIKPGEFTIKLLLDSTGIFSTLKPSVSNFTNQLTSLIPTEFSKQAEEEDLGVSDKIETLKTILFGICGDTHETYFIQISWAALEIKCKIKKVDIDYKLFNPQGYPIRAVVSLTCINTTSDVLRKAKKKLGSPDITHIRIVKEGDTLPLMAYRIYGDSKYYLEVAKANNILNFRNLIPGQEIYFPPLDKSISI